MRVHHVERELHGIKARVVPPRRLEHVEVMGELDEAYARWPFYGVRRMRAHLAAREHRVNVKRVRRLLRAMGLSDPTERRLPHYVRGRVLAIGR